jgi:predicted PurR-regulated permease PerM
MGSAAAATGNLAVTFLCLYFVLRSGDALWLRARRYLPFSIENSELLRHDLHRVTQATVLGMLLSAALQGASMAIGFRLAGLQGPIFWGVVTAFASVLPVVGSALVWVPAVVLLAILRKTGPALMIGLFGWLLPSAIDAIARARVSQRLGNVHPLTTLLGALIGIRLFGMIGLVVGPLIIAVFVELLNLYEREYGTPQSETPDGSSAAPFAIGLRAP